MLLTWEEGTLAWAEVQHFVETHHTEISPLVLWCERFHCQPIDRVHFARLKARGCSLTPLKCGPGKGIDEDNEVKGPTPVLMDPGCPRAPVSVTLQLQPLSHPELADVLGRPDLYLK